MSGIGSASGAASSDGEGRHPGPVSSGRWTIHRPGGELVEIMSSEFFRVEVDGELRVTRMVYALRDRMRAAIGGAE